MDRSIKNNISLKIVVLELIFLFATFVIILSACSNGSNGLNSISEPPLGEIKTITDPSQIHRPIEKYLTTVDEVFAAQHVLESKMNQCFKEHGLQSDYITYKDEDFAKKNIFEPKLDLTQGIWGFFKPRTASKWGFKSSAIGDVINIDPNNSKYVTEGYPVSQNSPIGQVCVTDIIKQAPSLGGDVSDGDFGEWLGVGYWPNGGPPNPITDSRFVSAQQKWADCMKQKGYNVATVRDGSYPPGYRSDQPPTASEKRMAEITVKCKIQTNLVGIGLAVQIAYDEQYIDNNKQSLEIFKQPLLDYIAGK
ncbi:MAG: hypothetical protein LBT99_00735 [Bifidobacteriaceae bacterium]|jgi:hypothetical protein|nr:hypothetical protein [Bifidobacteriaceae bacterium]